MILYSTRPSNNPLRLSQCHWPTDLTEVRSMYGMRRILCKSQLVYKALVPMIGGAYICT